MKVIPFGDRILVRRKVVGSTIGSGLLHAPDQIADRPTDLADVVYVPDNTFGDDEILANNDEIVLAMIKKIRAGDSEAMIALLRLNEFVKLKSIKVGDVCLISKYVGTDFLAKESNQTLTLVAIQDIIGVVKQ